MTILVPCLVSLRDEFNAVSPRRDRSSDGWLGDQRHALTSSDHNGDESGRTPYEDADLVDEVHGLDVDDSGPWPSVGWFDRKVEEIVTAHWAGRDDRLQNVIRNGRIASRTWGWTWRTYTGPNGHYEHAHFSSRYTTAQENDTSPWGVAPDPEDFDMTQDEFNDRMDTWWSSRMNPANTDLYPKGAVSGTSALGLLRRAPANLPTGASGTLFAVWHDRATRADVQAIRDDLDRVAQLLAQLVPPPSPPAAR